MGRKESKIEAARRELASAGGHARARALSKEDRTRIARLGGKSGGRGRRKEDMIPEELRERIWKLIAREAPHSLWWVSEKGRQPLSRQMAKSSLLSVACFGSLQTYKDAHELIRCL